jgi:hypothetical protein
VGHGVLLGITDPVGWGVLAGWQAAKKRKITKKTNLPTLGIIPPHNPKQ